MPDIGKIIFENGNESFQDKEIIPMPKDDIKLNEYTVGNEKYHHDRIVQSLKAENERLRGALQFYAEDENYSFCEPDGRVVKDKGLKARKALAEAEKVG